VDDVGVEEESMGEMNFPQTPILSFLLNGIGWAGGASGGKESTPAVGTSLLIGASCAGCTPSSSEHFLPTRGRKLDFLIGAGYAGITPASSEPSRTTSTKKPRKKEWRFGGNSFPPILLLLALLSACVAPPPPREPPLFYPASARERMLRIAIAEWEDWGRLTPETVPTSAEGSRENFPRVLAYWRALDPGGDRGAIARNRRRFSAGAGGVWDEPAWSAAFISFVLRAAGVDGREFPPSAAHATYVDALIADAAEFADRAPFVPHGPASYSPALGDLVCADRSPRPIADWAERAADAGRFRPMHCDIVVANVAGGVEAVGGNVRDAVTRTRLPTTPDGRLILAPGATPRIFAIFENRLGRLPARLRQEEPVS
jgi:hypothetical protein